MPARCEPVGKEVSTILVICQTTYLAVPTTSLIRGYKTLIYISHSSLHGSFFDRCTGNVHIILHKNSQDLLGYRLLQCCKQCPAHYKY
jgi:hypothetical protein